MEDQALDRIFMITERLIVFEGLDDVFEHIVKTAVAVTHAEAATIRIFDIETGNLKIVKGYGVTEGFLSQPPIRVGEGITGRVVQTGKPFFTPNLSVETNCVNTELAELEGIKSVISVPMKNSDSSIGCITVYRKTTESFDSHEMLLLSIFSAEAVQAVEKARLLNELKQQATFDPLTGLFNKRTFMAKLATEMERSQRHQYDLAVMFIDLDNFKKYNDLHGHLMGDKLIHDFTNILKQHCRKIDIIGRFGGDEFVIIAPQTNHEGALFLGNKLRQETKEQNFLTSEVDQTFSTTCSIGVAIHKPSDNLQAEALLELADKALYNSKNQGRDHVSVWPFSEVLETAS